MPRPLPPDQRDKIVGELTGGWSLIFNDSVEVFDRANFVNGEESRSPIFTAVRALSRHQCRQWARSGFEKSSGYVNSINANICTPYLDRISESPTSGSVALGYENGQCECGRYQATFNLRRADGVIIGSPAFRTRGPITGGRIASNGHLLVTTRGLLVGITTAYPGCDPTATEKRIGTNVYQPGTTIQNLSIQAALDGDSCGPIGPQITDPDNRAGLGNVANPFNITIPGYGPVTVTSTYNPDGTIQFCVAELDTCFTVGVEPGTDGGSAGGGPGRGDIGEAGAESDTGSGGDAEGEAPEGKVISGLKITILNSSPTAKPFENDFFRGVCYVYMGVGDDLALHPDGSTLKSGQFIFPEQDNLTKWKVFANSRYNLRAKPFYREVES